MTNKGLYKIQVRTFQLLNIQLNAETKVLSTEAYSIFVIIVVMF